MLGDEVLMNLFYISKQIEQMEENMLQVIKEAQESNLELQRLLNEKTQELQSVVKQYEELKRTAENIQREGKMWRTKYYQEKSRSAGRSEGTTV